MVKQVIGLGTTANDGTGDPLRTALDKVNDNFDELYAGTLPPAYISAHRVQLSGGLEGTGLQAGSAMAVNTIYYHPFLMRQAVTLSSLAARVTTISAAGNFALAIYAHNAANGRPSGAPLAATGNMSTGTATVVEADITGADVTFSPGLYWGAVWQDNGTAGYTVYTSATTPLLAVWVGSSAVATDVNLVGGPLRHQMLTSAETYNASAWPDATSETFTEVAGSNRAPIMMGLVA